MEFWGVEVKPGQPLKVQPEFGKLIHISQAALGEVKDVKGAKYVPLRLKIDDKKFIVGALSAEERPQLMFDLVIEREFELSHDWKNGSVYFIGYIGDDPVSDDEVLSDDDFEEIPGDVTVNAHQNGEVKLNSGDVKVAKTAAAVKSGDGKEESSSDEDEDEDDSDSDDDMADDAHEDSIGGSGEDEDSDDDSSEEEESPKVKQSKKRPAAVAPKAPVPAKKAKGKSATPDKPGGNKKGSKAAGKGPVGNKRK